MIARPLSLFAALLLSCTAGISQESKETPPAPGSLGDLFNKVKDIKVPESVTGLPKQITELKESYLETAKAVESLKIEVDTLRTEVYALRKENEELRASVGVKVKETEIKELLKPQEVSATDLVSSYKKDPDAADAKYRDRYLKVVGTISAFEAGSQTIILSLRADGLDSQVVCSLQTGADFFVDVVPTQGRLISRNDRRTLLTVGQPVSILGTCKGLSLNVGMSNCIIEGLTEKRKVEQVIP